MSESDSQTALDRMRAPMHQEGVGEKLAYSVSCLFEARKWRKKERDIARASWRRSISLKPLFFDFF